MPLNDAEQSLRDAAKQLADALKSIALENAKLRNEARKTAEAMKTLRSSITEGAKVQIAKQATKYAGIQAGVTPARARAIESMTTAQEASERARASRESAFAGMRPSARGGLVRVSEAEADYMKSLTHPGRRGLDMMRQRTTQVNFETEQQRQRTLQLNQERLIARVEEPWRMKKAEASHMHAEARLREIKIEEARPSRTFHARELAFQLKERRDVQAQRFSEIYGEAARGPFNVPTGPNLHAAAGTKQAPPTKGMNSLGSVNSQELINFALTLAPLQPTLRGILQTGVQRSGVAVEKGTPQEAALNEATNTISGKFADVLNGKDFGGLIQFMSNLPNSAQALEALDRAMGDATKRMDELASALGMTTPELRNAIQTQNPKYAGVIEESGLMPLVLAGIMGAVTIGGGRNIFGNTKAQKAVADAIATGNYSQLYGMVNPLQNPNAKLASLIGTGFRAFQGTGILGNVASAAGLTYASMVHEGQVVPGRSLSSVWSGLRSSKLGTKLFGPVPTPPTEGDSGAGGGILSSVMKLSPVALVGLAAGGALLGEIVSKVVQGMGQAITEGVTLNAPFRQLATSQGYNSLGSFMNTLNWQGAQNVLTPQMSAQVAGILASQMGNAQPLMPTFRAIAGAAAGTGLDVQQLASGYGSIVQAGFSSGPTSQNVSAREFAKMLASAVVEGQMQGRQGEVLQSLLSATQQMSQTLVGLPNLGSILGIQAAFNQTGIQGLMGQSGATILNQISQGMASPGAGAGGQLLNYRMIAQGNMTFPQLLFSEQAGAYFTPPGGKPNIVALLQNMRSIFPGLKSSSFAAKNSYYPLTGQAGMAELLMSQVYPVSMSQAGALLSVNPTALSHASQQMTSLYHGMGNVPMQALSIVSQLDAARTAKSPAEQRKYLASAAAQLKSTIGGSLPGIGSLEPYINNQTMSSSQTAKAIRSLQNWIDEHPGKFLTTAQQTQANFNQMMTIWIQVGKDLLPFVNAAYDVVFKGPKAVLPSVGAAIQDAVAIAHAPAAAIAGIAGIVKSAFSSNKTSPILKAMELWGHEEGAKRPNSAGTAMDNPLGLGGAPGIPNVTLSRVGNYADFVGHGGTLAGYKAAYQTLLRIGKEGNPNYLLAAGALDMAGHQLTVKQAAMAAAFFAARGGWAGTSNVPLKAAEHYAAGTGTSFNSKTIQLVIHTYAPRSGKTKSVHSVGPSRTKKRLGKQNVR